MLELPRMLCSMAGEVVGRLAAWKEAGVKWIAWRAEMEAVEKRLSSRADVQDAALADLRRELAARSDGPQAVEFAAMERQVKDAFATFALRDEVEARFVAQDAAIKDAAATFVRRDELEVRFVAQDGRLRGIEKALEEQRRRIDAATSVAAALEKSAGPRFAELEQRMELQARSLLQMGAARSEMEAALKRALESMDALSRAGSARPAGLTKVGAAPASAAQFVEEDAELLKLLHIQL
jgi:hypothetical protein